MRRLSTRLAAPLLLLAAVAVAGEPILSSYHFATVSHFFCPEHGTMAHGRHGARTTFRPAGSASRLLGRDAPLGILLDHEVCPHEMLGRRSELPPWAAQTVATTRCVEVEEAVVSNDDGPSVPLLSLAPKASPPSPASRAAGGVAEG